MLRLCVLCVLYANVKDKSMFTARHSLRCHGTSTKLCRLHLYKLNWSVLVPMCCRRKNGRFVKLCSLNKLIRQNVSLSDVVELIQQKKISSVGALFRDWTKLPAAHMIPDCGTHARVR